MRIKTYNKRKSKNNIIKFQTSSKILKCHSSMEKRHFNIEACCGSAETEDYFVFKDEIKEIK